MGFSPLARERKENRPSIFPPTIHLNFSSSFLCPISPPRLPATPYPFSFSRLSLCHSRSRRTRSSCFTPTFSTTLILLSALPSQFQPLFLSFSFSLFVSSPFSSISRPSFCLSHRPSPSFFLSLGRFIASSTTLRSPPSTPLPAFFLFCRACWFHLLILSSPPTPKTLFSRGPFASTVIRHPSFFFSLPLFFRLTPMIGRDNLPFSLVLSYISVLTLSLLLSLFLFL